MQGSYNLNTSYVNVNPDLAGANLASADNLNTSYVNVNQYNELKNYQVQLYLNTSYVNVNPLILSHSYISIILFSSHSIKLL